MKVKFLLMFLLLSANVAFSQVDTLKANGMTIPDNAVSGKIVNGVFICDRFDWEMKIPENYKIINPKTLENMEAQGEGKLKENLPEDAKLIKRSHLIGFGLSSTNMFSASFNPMENTTKMSLSEHKATVLDLMKKTYGQIPNVRCEFTTSEIKIGKYDFYEITIKAFNESSGDFIISQKYYNSYIDNHIFSVLIGCSIEEEGKMLERNFLSSLRN